MRATLRRPTDATAHGQSAASGGSIRGLATYGCTCEPSGNLTILKIGPKELPFGSGYTTRVRRCAMVNAVPETSADTATVFANRFRPAPPRAITWEEPVRALNAPE